MKISTVYFRSYWSYKNAFILTKYVIKANKSKLINKIYYSGVSSRHDPSVFPESAADFVDACSRQIFKIRVGKGGRVKDGGKGEGLRLGKRVKG